MEKEYRIIKVTRANGRETYRIQRRTRLMWIGPYIWETYWYDYRAQHKRWSYHIELGDDFSSVETAAYEIKGLRLQDASQITKTEVTNYE